MYRFADAYGANNYGNGTYACNSQQTSGTGCAAGTSTGGSSSSPLANTGILVALIVGVACLLLLIAVLVRFWRRPAKKAQEPAVAAGHKSE